ncbi:MAG: hypothetical protein LBE13_16200 [Bacteroidales bacterium]|jgi:predicted  nucleic acid-binding Zn-ribbon protein|nr:hypothetical protein [Bacteroidales bacterium]
MKKYFKQDANLSITGTMEFRDHFKNGARKNWASNIVWSVIAGLLLGVSACSSPDFSKVKTGKTKTEQEDQQRIASEQREREAAAEKKRQQEEQQRLAQEQREREAAAAAEKEAIAEKERLEQEKEERLKQYTIFTTFDKIMIVKKNNLYGAIDLNGYVKIEIKYANVLQAKDNDIDIIKFYNKSFNNYDIYDKTGNFIKTTTK